MSIFQAIIVTIFSILLGITIENIKNSSKNIKDYAVSDSYVLASVCILIILLSFIVGAK